MSIVKGLVEKMGGTIRVSSTPGVGTEFRFYLSFPVVQPEKESQNKECVQRTKQDMKEDKPLRGYHILLAEDNEINMEIAEFYLEEAGAQVTKAWNGREAAELFKQSGLREYEYHDAGVGWKRGITKDPLYGRPKGRCSRDSDFGNDSTGVYRKYTSV